MVGLLLLLYTLLGGYLTIGFIDLSITLAKQIANDNQTQIQYPTFYFMIFLMSFFMTFVTPLVYLFGKED